MRRIVKLVTRGKEEQITPINTNHVIPPSSTPRALVKQEIAFETPKIGDYTGSKLPTPVVSFRNDEYMQSWDDKLNRHLPLSKYRTDKPKPFSEESIHKLMIKLETMPIWKLATYLTLIVLFVLFLILLL